MAINVGGQAFPSAEHNHDGSHYIDREGMSLRDFAEIHFAAAWAIALGSQNLSDSREARTAEANRLGRIQADEFISMRETK
jgi:hypothetical protein